MPSNSTEYQKNYFNTHRDKLIKYASQHITCDLCNSIIIRNSIYRHQKSKKCQKIINMKST